MKRLKTKEKSSVFSKNNKPRFVQVLTATFLLLCILGLQYSLVGVKLVFAADPPAVPVNTLRPAPNTALPSQDQTLNVPSPELNPNDSAFKIVVCDGPTLPKDYPNKPAGYVPCDFNGVMRQIQHLINIMMVLGVLIAIVMFSYAGGLYITGQKANIDKAHSIFPKVFIGFIIMLSAWFIVYQILSWLTNNEGFKALLGSP